MKFCWKALPARGNVKLHIACGERSPITTGARTRLKLSPNFIKISPSGRGAAWISALAWGARGRGFKSLRPDTFLIGHRRNPPHPGGFFHGIV